jgi:hypothetical protein
MDRRCSMHEMNTKYVKIFGWKASSEETTWKVILKQILEK